MRKPPPNRLRKGQAALNRLIYQYKKGAKKRGIPFNLAIKEIVKLFKQNCFYCGQPPSKEKIVKETFGSYLYNGIDRVNSNIGYSIKNCVTCCYECNIMKGKLNSLEFLEKVKEIFENIIVNFDKKIDFII